MPEKSAIALFSVFILWYDLGMNKFIKGIIPIDNSPTKWGSKKDIKKMSKVVFSDPNLIAEIKYLAKR